MICQAIYYLENKTREEEWQQQMEQREQALLTRMSENDGGNRRTVWLEKEVIRIYQRFEAILNPISPCCNRAFQYGDKQCDAITCQECKVRFCALCLKRNTVHEIARLNPAEECPVHAHVRVCPENQDYRGEYFTNPWYPLYRKECRFGDEWNDWIEETDDDELIELVYERVKLIIEGTHLTFYMDDGTTELLKSLTGKYHIRMQMSQDEKNELCPTFRRERDRLEAQRLVRERRDALERRRIRREERRRRARQVARAQLVVANPNPRGRRRCGRCHQEGHDRRRCPELMRERQQAEPVVEEGEPIREQLENQIMEQGIEQVVERMREEVMGDVGAIVEEHVGEVVGEHVGEVVGEAVGEAVEEVVRRGFGDDFGEMDIGQPGLDFGEDLNQEEIAYIIDLTRDD